MSAKERSRRYYWRHRERLLAERALKRGLSRPAHSMRRCVCWSSLLADDIDEAVVQRLMEGGYDGAYTSWERREAVRRLTGHGLSQMAVSRRTGIHVRQVARDSRYNATHDASSVGFPVEQEATG